MDGECGGVAPMNVEKNCRHCYHPFTGPLWMVLKDGEVVEECCLCRGYQVVHREHRWESCNFPWATFQ